MLELGAEDYFNALGMACYHGDERTVNILLDMGVCDGCRIVLTPIPANIIDVFMKRHFRLAYVTDGWYDTETMLNLSSWLLCSELEIIPFTGVPGVRTKFQESLSDTLLGERLVDSRELADHFTKCVVPKPPHPVAGQPLRW